MWCRLPSPLRLLLVLVLVQVLLSISEAETLSEFDRCVLGDCGPLTAAGGATVAPSEDAGGRDKDGASVAALKRSPQDAPAGVTEQAEGSGGGESGADDGEDRPDVNPALESGQTTESEAEGEQISTSPPAPKTTPGDGTEDNKPSPPPQPPTTTTTADQPTDPPSGQKGGDGPIEPTESTETAGDSGAERTDDPAADGPEGGGSEDGTDELDWRTDHCSCDLAVSDCDPDCCCDLDCSAEDRRTFSACQSRPPLTPDPRYCLQADLIFSNNTELRMERVEGGLFCIVRDNLVSRNSFPVVQPVSSSVEFDRLLSVPGGRRRYQWPSEPPPPPPPPAADRYRSGDPLWTLAQGGVTRWAVRWRGPVSSGLCDAYRPVRFLRPAETDCWLRASQPGDLGPLDGNSVFQGVCLLTAPHTGPLQDLQDVQCGAGGGAEKPETAEDPTEKPPVQGLSVVPYLCDADHQNCTQVSSVPSPRVSSGRVSDALLSVLLVLEHRAGVLSSVRAEMVLGPAPLDSAVRQRRRVEFRRPGGPPPVFRSGNPGYQRHRPVLVAEVVTNSTAEGGRRLVPVSGALPILLPSPGRGGGCSSESGRWRPLLFGVDAVVGCRLESVSEDCPALQRRVMETLLAGLPAPVEHTAVAAFGSAAPDGDWIPVLTSPPDLSPETAPAGCRGLVTSAQWRVLFAQSGAAHRPQARVVGVRLSFGRPGAVVRSEEDSGRRSITVQSTVMFEDVTRRPVPSFARPPRVDISLPADFFYPFSSGGQGGSAPAPAQTALLTAALVLAAAA